MSPDIRGFELPWPRRAEKSRDGIFLLTSPSGCGFPPRGRTFPWPSFHIRAHAPILSLFPALFRPYLGLKQVNANRQEFFKVLYGRCVARLDQPDHRCTYGLAMLHNGSACATVRGCRKKSSVRGGSNRVCTISDVVDGMTTRRPHTNILSRSQIPLEAATSGKLPPF